MIRDANTGRLDGPDGGPERPGMREALRLLFARRGPVPTDYRPPISAFPSTPAAREAVRLNRERDTERRPRNGHPLRPPAATERGNPHG